MPGPKRQPIELRFAAYLVRAGDHECWGWSGPITNSGHPTFGRGGKGAAQISARIVAYRLSFGDEPDREVLTTCDTKTCLKPRHLVLAGGDKSKATLLAYGPIPEELFVKQQRGNRLCCNSAHLYLFLNPIDGPEASARAVACWPQSRA